MRTFTTMNLITKTPQAHFVTMTKELVDSLLALNTRNRNQRPFTVETYQRAINGGLWVPTNQGIGVAASGFLIDGQHRLEALKSAGYPPVTMLVVTGLPDEAMAAVDGGANRNARDYMQFMFDTSISHFVSAIIRTSLLARDEFHKVKYQPQEFAAHFQEIGGSISELMKIPRLDRLPCPVVAALVDSHHKGYQSEVEAFTKALVTGEMLERDNPALVLRNWVAANKGHSGNNALIERYRKTSRALQAWVDQRPLAKLYLSKTPLAVGKERSKKTVAV